MKRLIAILISIISLIIIVNTFRSIVTLWQRGNIVSEQQALLNKKQQENEDLQKKLAEVESPDFIEKQAREKLNLQKEGEVVVILPKTDNKQQVTQETIKQPSNWQKWWKLIIN